MQQLAVLYMAALLAPCVLPCAAQERYDNPVDKQTYVTAGQFKTYAPATPRDTRGQRVTTAKVMLLTGEPDLAARVALQDLVSYLKETEVLAYAALGKNTAAMAALVQFNCRPGQCDVALSTQGMAEDAPLQALHAALSARPPLKTTGEVIFQIAFKVAE